jgi:hypothetical protein
VEGACLNLVLVTIWKKIVKKKQWYKERDHRVGRWGANPKIASLVNSMLHVKGGGSREGNDTFMSNTNCQGIEN